MPVNRSVLLVPALCLVFGPALPAQTAGSYFQTLVKDAKTRITEISPGDLNALRARDSSVILVDLREDDEWGKSRIPGAIHVGRGVLERDIESRVSEKAGRIVVYCAGGSRSAVGADVLAKMGYTNVSSLAGGIRAWESADLPIDKTAPPPQK